MKNKNKRILVISHDRVGKSMAGPGMRYHQIAIELSKKFAVSLATFNPAYLDGLDEVPYKFFDIHVQQYQKIFDKFDAIFALWLSPEMITYAKSKNIQLIFDMYAPGPVEEMVSKIFSGHIDSNDEYNYTALIEYQKSFFHSADFIVCSNPIQKDFWTGFAFASGAVSPAQYASFPVYDRIAELPMGINLDDLKFKTNVNPLLKRIPKLKESDFVVVWTGGIWDWFDATTPLKAMKKLVDGGTNIVKLVFLGTRHPNSDVPEMKETKLAFKLAKDYGLIDKYVFFLDGWIPYEERVDYFSSADAALYAHKPSIEAQYSHRTRVLDHFLMNIPTIATRGDYLASIIESTNLGLIVEPTNVTELHDAILKLSLDKSLQKTIKNNIQAIKESYTWANTCKPLVDFLETNNVSRPIFTQKPLPPQGSQPARVLKKLLPRRAKELLKKFYY